MLQYKLTKIFKPGIWLAGCRAASQLEAMLENSCQRTWILTWILLSNPGSRSDRHISAGFTLFMVSWQWHPQFEMLINIYHTRINIPIVKEWVLFCSPQESEVIIWLDTTGNGSDSNLHVESSGNAVVSLRKRQIPHELCTRVYVHCSRFGGISCR